MCNLIPKTLDFFPHQRKTPRKLRPPVPKFHSETITDATKGGEGRRLYRKHGSLSIIMALADAMKIKTISCFNQARFENINEGFPPF